MGSDGEGRKTDRLIKDSRVIGDRMHQHTADAEDLSGIEQAQGLRRAPVPCRYQLARAIKEQRRRAL